ncbi:MAG: hypothetical protein ACXV79_18515 [Methylobacter sp.]
MVNPLLGEKVMDPACGTYKCSFLKKV